MESSKKTLFPKSNTVFNQRIYVINLKRRQDKKRLIEYKLSKHKIPVSEYCFFEAIDGFNNIYNNIYETAKSNFNSKGAFGLILTYVALLEHAFNNNYDRIMILEDDVNIHKKYNKLIQHFDKIINEESYDLIWLGANQTYLSSEQRNDIKTLSTYCPEPSKKNYTYGTFSIIVNKTGIVKLMNVINKNNITNLKPVDNVINDMICSESLKTIVCYPYLFMPDVSDSDNMGPRDQDTFSASRGYNINDYCYVSQQDITFLRSYLNSNKQYNQDNQDNKHEIYVTLYERLSNVIKNKKDLLRLLFLTDED
jgi:GR25 family glycosyltransferase involved in LPS biosynthesis